LAVTVMLAAVSVLGAKALAALALERVAVCLSAAALLAAPRALVFLRPACLVHLLGWITLPTELMALAARSGLSGPQRLAHSLQPTQVICNA
jgi:hypothetical protein